MDAILHLTHDCQLDCAYCYSGRKRGDTMPWEVARQALDMAFDQSPPDAATPITVGFFGGEPLLEMDLIRRSVAHAEARSSADGKPVRFAVTTNGLALDHAAADLLAEKGTDLTFSMDGGRPAQEACRPYADGSSSFDDTERALRHALDYFSDLAVCAVVTPENVRHLPESIDFLLKTGIRRLFLNPNFFASWQEEQLALWRQGYQHAAARFAQAFRRGDALNVNFITAKVITHLKGGYDPCECCDFGAKEVAVAPSGNIYPCQRMVGEDVETLGLMGNVFSGLDREKLRELAAGREVRSPQCLTCDLRRRCRNWCSCVNHRLTGRFDQVGGLVCWHERMAIEVADEVASRLFAEKDPTFLRTFYFETVVAPEWV